MKHLLATHFGIRLQVEGFSRDVINLKHQGYETVLGHFNVKADSSVKSCNDRLHESFVNEEP